MRPVPPHSPSLPRLTPSFAPPALPLLHSIQAGKEYAAQLIIATNAKLRDPATAQAGGAMGGLGFFGS